MSDEPVGGQLARILRQLPKHGYAGNNSLGGYDYQVVPEHVVSVISEDLTVFVSVLDRNGVCLSTARFLHAPPEAVAAYIQAVARIGS